MINWGTRSGLITLLGRAPCTGGTGHRCHLLASAFGSTVFVPTVSAEISCQEHGPRMKHQYFGDVNDYMKYGILRCLSQAGFRIGVCWMLTPDDKRPDGRRVNYLSQPQNWKHHDADLFGHLSQALSIPNGRHLHHIETNGRIPSARFFGKVVPKSRTNRLQWVEDALTELNGSDLLFFDPDNGIEVPTIPMGRKGSSKYASGKNSPKLGSGTHPYWSSSIFRLWKEESIFS